MREDNIHTMSEKISYIAFPSFLNQFAKGQFESGSQLLIALEEVIYLFHNYVHSTHIA